MKNKSKLFVICDNSELKADVVYSLQFIHVAYYLLIAY